MTHSKLISFSITVMVAIVLLLSVPGFAQPFMYSHYVNVGYSGSAGFGHATRLHSALAYQTPNLVEETHNLATRTLLKNTSLMRSITLNRCTWLPIRQLIGGLVYETTRISEGRNFCS